MYGIYANIWGILMVNVTIYIYIAYVDPMGIWLTKYHSDSLSLCCASPLWSVPRCSPRPAKGTGARLQEADAMNNPWVWGPSDNDWLKGNIPEHTGYHMDPYGF